MWLPALGAALFVAAGVWWALQPKAKPPADIAPETAASAPASAASGNPGQPPPPGADTAAQFDKALERIKALQKKTR
jgi:hypothetical protein